MAIIQSVFCRNGIKHFKKAYLSVSVMGREPTLHKSQKSRSTTVVTQEQSKEKLMYCGVNMYLNSFLKKVARPQCNNTSLKVKDLQSIFTCVKAKN